jgi:hypothetical protein
MTSKNNNLKWLKFFCCIPLEKNLVAPNDDDDGEREGEEGKVVIIADQK